MASYVVTQLTGLNVQPEPIVNLDLDHYRVLHQRLIEHEETLFGTAMQVQVMDEVANLYSFTITLMLVSWVLVVDIEFHCGLEIPGVFYVS